jgi:UDP-3-O-[3-hydroxymyristoyl] N-acetylglucosamine deacetylase
MFIKQRTLKNVVCATGVGVHSGEQTLITLRPAPPNTGIVFRRMDLNPPVEIPARVEFIGDTVLATGLMKDGARVMTIEHLLSALVGLGIDNAYIDLNSAEVPIMDGSASPFVFLIQSAGSEKQDEPKRFVQIKEEILVTDGDKYVKLEPFDGFRISFTIDYNHPLFNEDNQKTVFDFSNTTYVKEISRARTYGFMSDYEHIRKNNLALGASLKNAVVLDATSVMNEEGLRYPNECVKHKVLDVIGDLYLLSHTIIGAFTGYKSGHALNGLLLRELLTRPDSWEIVTIPNGSRGFVEQESSVLPG